MDPAVEKALKSFKRAMSRAVNVGKKAAEGDDIKTYFKAMDAAERAYGRAWKAGTDRAVLRGLDDQISCLRRKLPAIEKAGRKARQKIREEQIRVLREEERAAVPWFRR